MKILVAVDFSDVTDRLVGVVENLRSAREGELWLVHVSEPDPAFVGFEGGPDTVRDETAGRYRREHDELHALSSRLEEAGIRNTPLLVQGPVTEKILEQAAELGIEMLVIGSHGHGAAWELLVGSVSRQIIRRADVPVLVVPARGG